MSIYIVRWFTYMVIFHGKLLHNQMVCANSHCFAYFWHLLTPFLSLVLWLCRPRTLETFIPSLHRTCRVFALLSHLSSFPRRLFWSFERIRRSQTMKAHIGPTRCADELITERIDFEHLWTLTGFVGFGSPGSTALMYAAHGGHEDVCTVLLEARASHGFSAWHGLTCRWILPKCCSWPICCIDFVEYWHFCIDYILYNIYICISISIYIYMYIYMGYYYRWPF